MSPNKDSFYQDITNKIIGLLEKVSLEDYKPPFTSLAAQGLPINPFTKKQYQGVNIPALWFYQQEQGYNSNQWATFKQWKQKGATVRKGEKGNTICFYKTLLIDEENDQGEEQTNKIPMMKLYKVFNACQVEGYEHRETAKANDEDHVERLELVDEFCGNTGAHIIHKRGGRAYYHLEGDYIHMPDTFDFIKEISITATENYYSTLLHELTHWTGASKRLDRFNTQELQKKEAYAKEELCAELGASFLCAQLGINQSPREDHAIYIKSWLQALKNDNKHIFRSSAQAARAVDYLNKLQPQ